MNIVKLTKLIKSGEIKNYLTQISAKEELKKITKKKIGVIFGGVLGMILVSKIPMSEMVGMLVACAYTTGMMMLVIHYTEVGRDLKQLFKLSGIDVTEEEKEEEQNNEELINEPIVIKTKNDTKELTTKEILIGLRKLLLTIHEKEEEPTKDKQKTKNL